LRKYDVVLTDPNGVSWGFEIKSSESAFSRWEPQQFNADRWINMQQGPVQGVGKSLGTEIQGSVKILWPTP
jgi:hypothetical protein